MAPRFDRVLLKHIEKQDNEKARLILEQADDPYNLADSFGNTLLHYAAKYKNLDMTKYLLESGSSVDAQNKDGKTPLILAMEHCDADATIDVSKVLLNANADINICDRSGTSPLILAVDRLVSFAWAGWEFFWKKLEIQYSYGEIANLLVNIGCDLTVVLLMNCAEVTRVMLKRGMLDDYSWRSRGHCCAPLVVAVKLMQLENVKLLLEHGANVNELDDDGRTPASCIDLTHKDANLVIEILKALLDGGAQMYVPSSDVMQMQSLLEGGNKDVIRLLMKHDFDLNKRDKDGMTAMHTLARNPNPGVFAELRGKSFDFDARDKYNVTPLRWANCNPSSVKFLLDHGADVNAVNDDGITVLMTTFVYRGDEQARLESIELLLLYGADVEIVNPHIPHGITIFDAPVEYVVCKKLIEPVLAHLAILKAGGKQIPALVSERLRVHQKFQKRFDFHTQQVESTKNIIVCQSITLHNLLIDNDEKIAGYMRNEELVRKLSRLDNKCGLTSYYHKYLRKRLTRAMQVAKLKEGAALVLCKMTGLDYGANSVIVDKIIYYLDYADMKELHYVHK